MDAVSANNTVADITNISLPVTEPSNAGALLTAGLGPEDATCGDHEWGMPWSSECGMPGDGGWGMPWASERGMPGPDAGPKVGVVVGSGML